MISKAVVQPQLKLGMEDLFSPHGHLLKSSEKGV